MSTQRPSRSPSRRTGLAPIVAQRVLDRVDDRLDLPVVGGRAEQERVGDDELLGDVEGDDVLGQLVRGRLGGGADELEGPVGGGHGWFPSFEVGWCRGRRGRTW